MRGDLLQGRPNIEQRVVRLKKDFDRRINRYQSLALNDHKGPKKSEIFLLCWMVVGPFSRLSPSVIRLPFPASY